MNIIKLALILLVGCFAYPVAHADEDGTCEQGIIVNGYFIGYLKPGWGYWTGSEWDSNFYMYGHDGYGHSYCGAQPNIPPPNIIWYYHESREDHERREWRERQERERREHHNREHQEHHDNDHDHH